MTRTRGGFRETRSARSWTLSARGHSGRPVLYDFNTAVRHSEPVETRFGADQFKAPELLADAGADADIPVGGHSDVFSWGKLAFYLLTRVKVLTPNVPEGGLDPRDHGGAVHQTVYIVPMRVNDTCPDAPEHSRR